MENTYVVKMELGWEKTCASINRIMVAIVIKLMEEQQLHTSTTTKSETPVTPHENCVESCRHL
jgi:hypothetical protein